MRNMRHRCITCDSHVQHARVICVSQMRQPKDQLSVTGCDTRCDSHAQHAMEYASRTCCHQNPNSLSSSATQPATRRFNMRLACSVAYGPIRFFFPQKSEKFDNFWIKWPFGESSSLWRFEGVQEHKNKSKIQLPSNQLQIDSNFGFKFSSM